MKLKITKSLLISALNKCNPILPSRPVVQSMNCALVVAEGSQISITVTNMDQRITAKVEAEILEPGSTLIPFKRLLDLIDKMSGDILISADEQNIAIITCGNAKSKIYGLPANEFVPKAESGKPLSKFRDKEGCVALGLNRVKCAASSEQTRMILNGVHFTETDGKLLLEASDGRRGHRIQTNIKSTLDIIVPTQAVQSIAELFAECDCEFRIYENRIEVESGVTILESKLIEGQFPKFRDLIPPPLKDAITFDRDQLLGSLKIVSTMLDEHGRVTILSSKVGVNISSTIGTDITDVDLNGKQKVEMKLMMSAGQLKDAITNIESSEIRLEARNNRDSIVIRDGNFLAIIMPFRFEVEIPSA